MNNVNIPEKTLNLIDEITYSSNFYHDIKRNNKISEYKFSKITKLFAISIFVFTFLIWIIVGNRASSFYQIYFLKYESYINALLAI
jgi:hypothetical protein